MIYLVWDEPPPNYILWFLRKKPFADPCEGLFLRLLVKKSRLILLAKYSSLY